MRHQPLLLDRPFGIQFVLAVILPALFGLLTGYLLGVSAGAYFVLSVLGILGGLAAGYDHLGATQGLLRGLVGGSLFGVFILVGHSVFGEAAKAHVPEPYALLVVITTVLGGLLGAWGGSLRAKSEAKEAATA